MTELTQKKLQKEIFEIFLEVKCICDKLGIDYFIIGGTALGAVRHGGFIPWDDDFDIGMTRENYEKFLSCAEQYLNQNLFLQTFKTDKHSPFYFAKVRKNNTSFIERYCRNLPIHHGVYIDIFPFDTIPDSDRARKKYYRQGRKRLNWYIAKEVCGISANPGILKRFVLETVRTIMHIIILPVPKKILYRRLDTYLQQYNHSKGSQLGYAGLPKIQVPKEDVINPATILFEGVKVKCPCHIKEYLEHNFGDYMAFPPEHERAGHDIIYIAV